MTGAEISTGPGPWIRGYVKFVQKRALFVLGFWGVLLVCGAIWGLNLLNCVQLTVEAPPGTQGANAVIELKKDFPNQADSLPLLYLLHVKAEDNKNILTAENLQNKFIKTLNESIANHMLQHPEDISFVDTTKASTYLASKQQNVSLPCIFPFNKLPGCKDGKVSLPFAVPQPVINLHPETEAYWAFVNVDVQVPDGKITNPVKIFTQYMVDKQLTVLNDAFNGTDKDKVEVWMTGFPILANEVTAGIEKNMLQMDVTAFPLAILTLAYILGSLRLLMIPIASIVISLLVAFVVVWQIALKVAVISFAPSMMMSVMLAMSVDYSLFLLSRYRQELLRGREPLEAVTYMVCYAGHTVLVSGSTLILCFLSLMFFPSVMFQSMGYASALSLAITLCVNLSLTPTLLLLFGNFFRRSILPSKVLNCVSRTVGCGEKIRDPPNNIYEDEHEVSAQRQRLINDDDESAADKADNKQSVLEVELNKLTKTRWYKFVNSVSSYPKIVIFILIGVAIPCGWRAHEFARTVNLLSLVPRGSEGTEGYIKLGYQYGSGGVAPYYLVTKTPGGDAASVYNLTQSILNELPRRRVLAENATLEVLLEFCLAFPKDLVCPQLVAVNNTQDDQPKKIVAVITSIFLLDDPYAGIGLDWYPDTISVMNKHTALVPGSEAYLSGGAATFIDSVTAVYARYTTIIGATIVFVMLWIGVAFRSILIPLRAVVTIGCTICYVYGIAVWTYEYGIFDWLHFAGMTPTIEVGEVHGAIYWMVPIMTFSILVGLGLDYDVFLISRVVEYRKAGVSSRDAIICGTAMTGGIITAAGIIMGIAFAGLLFCNEAVLNELSFFLLIAVLIDTMVIRTMLVPAIMLLLGEANWWPTKVPEPVIVLKRPSIVALPTLR
eukprot:m.239504 g.239504  ORF g.239504 m.239504 type:complete len:890 (-) comp33745_c6_seq1:229-2898(-)